MPDGASAAGEAFELLSSRYLCSVAGLKHLAAPFYTHLKHGRWVQFDGLFSRRGRERLVLEAKFHGAPVSLATAGIAARLTFAKESGASGIIIASKSGFHRDMMRLKLPIEKVLLSWAGMRRGLAGHPGALLTVTLDPVEVCREGFVSGSGARLHVGHKLGLSGDPGGLAYVPVEVERWLRRLSVSPHDIDMCRPPRKASPRGRLDIEGTWVIEDSLRGFAPSDPRLAALAIRALGSGPLTLTQAWKSVWRLGHRGRKGGVKNALDNLCVMTVAEKFRNENGLFYGLSSRIDSSGDAEDVLATAVRQWPAFAYFKASLEPGDAGKNAIAARLSERFAPFFPYARSLYNPAKVSGLLALDRYLSPTSTTRPS